MNATEAMLLCRTAKAACPQQAIDEYTPDIWLDLLEDLRFEDAKAALLRVAAKQPFVAPAEIRTEVRRIRAKRIADNEAQLTPPADSREGAALHAWLREAKQRLGDGEPIETVNPPAIDGKDRYLPDLRILMPRPESEQKAGTR